MRVEEYKGSRAEENQEREKKKGKGKKPIKEEEKRQTQQQLRGAPYGRPRPRFEVMQTERVPERKKQKGGKEKFCQYHRWAGHATDECRALKGHIDQLIKEGAPRKQDEVRRDDRCREDTYKRRRHDRSPPRDQGRRRAPERRDRVKREYKRGEERGATSWGEQGRKNKQERRRPGEPVLGSCKARLY